MNFNNNEKMIKAATDPKYRELLQVARKLEKTKEYKAHKQQTITKRKEEGRKKLVGNLSEFFGKPPLSGGKRKTKRKKRSRRKKTKKSRRRRRKKKTKRRRRR
uniref:Uncharacterized protein n=1 Tax=viral metagenome TaxID=1070528 RepID=A0A6C0KAV0_9ZZZZ